MCVRKRASVWCYEWGATYIVLASLFCKYVLIEKTSILLLYRIYSLFARNYYVVCFICGTGHGRVRYLHRDRKIRQNQKYEIILRCRCYDIIHAAKFWYWIGYPNYLVLIWMHWQLYSYLLNAVLNLNGKQKTSSRENHLRANVQLVLLPGFETLLGKGENVFFLEDIRSIWILNNFASVFFFFTFFFSSLF